LTIRYNSELYTLKRNQLSLVTKENMEVSELKEAPQVIKGATDGKTNAKSEN